MTGQPSSLAITMYPTVNLFSTNFSLIPLTHHCSGAPHLWSGLSFHSQSSSTRIRPQSGLAGVLHCQDFHLLHFSLEHITQVQSVFDSCKDNRAALVSPTFLFISPDLLISGTDWQFYFIGCFGQEIGWLLHLGQMGLGWSGCVVDARYWRLGGSYGLWKGNSWGLLLFLVFVFMSKNIWSAKLANWLVEEGCPPALS